MCPIGNLVVIILANPFLSQLVKLPISRELQSDADKTYVLVAKLKVDGQEVSAVVDTGSSYTFLIWKYWYEVTEKKRCDEMVYKCYECNPGPCEVGPTKEVYFADGSVATIFEHPGQLESIGTVGKVPVTFGLTANYKYVPGYSAPTAGFGVGLKLEPRGSFEPLVEQLVSQKVIGSKTFSLYTKADDHPTGELILGGVDPSLYREPVLYLPLVDADHVGLTGFRVGGSTYPIEATSADVILDTGASGISMPESFLKQVVGFLRERGKKKIPVAKLVGRYYTRCELIDDLPSITFYMKGVDGQDVSLTISSKDYVSPFPVAEYQLCPLLMEEALGDEWTIGYMALIGRYFVYNWDDKKIGVAELK